MGKKVVCIVLVGIVVLLAIAIAVIASVVAKTPVGEPEGEPEDFFCCRDLKTKLVRSQVGN